MISLGRKTARLTITSPHGKGRIWFEKGTAIHARTEDLTGDDAFFRIMSCDSGKFYIEHDIPSEERTIVEETMLLVMEGLRQRDEARISAEDSSEPEQDEEMPAEQSSPSASSGSNLAMILEVAFAAAVFGALAVLVPLHYFSKASEPAVEAMTVPDGRPSRFSQPVVSSSPVDDRSSDLFSPLVSTYPAMDLLQSYLDSEVNESSKEPSEPQPPVPEVKEDEVIAATLPADPPSDPAQLQADAAGLDEADTEPTAAEPVAVDLVEAYLDLHAKSAVKQGTLVILIDGSEVYSREMVSEHRGAKRFFKKLTRSAGKGFEERLTVESGQHEVVARLIKPDGTNFQDTILVDLEPGQAKELQLLVGHKRGKSVVWKTDGDEPKVASSRLPLASQAAQE
jgi:hypothetical protein